LYKAWSLRSPKSKPQEPPDCQQTIYSSLLRCTILLASLGNGGLIQREGGIAYQNRAPAPPCQQSACRVLIPQPRCKHGRRCLLPVVLLNNLNRCPHVAGDFEHTDSISKRHDRLKMTEANHLVTMAFASEKTKYCFYREITISRLGLENGKYSAWFRTPLGEGTGVVLLKDGQITGGDTVLAYTGSYNQDGDTLRWTLPPNAIRRGSCLCSESITST
jgi:hypothetical protein